MKALNLDATIYEARAIAKEMKINLFGLKREAAIAKVNEAIAALAPKAEQPKKKGKLTNYQQMLLTMMDNGFEVRYQQSQVDKKWWFALVAADGEFFWTRSDSVRRLLDEGLIYEADENRYLRVA